MTALTAGLGAAALVLAALLPGAMFAWSFERWAGRFGIGLKDRALRFMGLSAILLSMAAGPLYWVYANHWDAFASRKPLPMWFWSLPILYFFVPLVMGSLSGYAWKKNWPGARFIIGRNRVPRAWDHLFHDRPAGGIRCKLKSGTWIAGIYAETNTDRPFASEYPEQQDLYLPATLGIDPHTGQILTNGSNEPLVLDPGVLVRWDEIEFLEFTRPVEG